MGSEQSVIGNQVQNAEAPEARAKDGRDQARFQVAELLAAPGDKSTHVHDDKSKVPSLPDIDLHSGLDPEADHSAKAVAEELVDDIHTLVNNNADGKITFKEKQPAKLDPGAGDLPVIYTPDVEPGKIGVLMNKNKDGHTYYTPFVAGDPKTLLPNAGTPSIVINESAAKELRIDDDLKKGLKPQVDIIAFPYNDAGVLPKNKEDLHSLVKEKLHEMAEDIRDKQAEEWQKIEATLPDPPKPDPIFGYRRTDRSAAELQKISDEFRNLARESQKAWEPAGIQDRMKDFGVQAQNEIKKYQDEVNKRSIAFDRAQQEEAHLLKRAEKVDSVQAALLRERAKNAGDEAKAIDAKLQVAKYNLSYAQAELKISKDQDAYVRHMQARASAAAIMALNPDMQGSLDGHYVVVNSGHWAGDPKFPGFEKDDTAEWKLNFESQDVAASMIKMAGGAVKLVNQIDLPKDDRGMTGLANAIKSAKSEVAISIHHDDGEPPDADAMKGTLTLQCAKTSGAESLEFAKALHMAKTNYSGLDDKYNKNGVSVGIREQCGRGIQGHNVGAPFVLDEQLSTHKDYWPLARDPKINAQIQFAKVTALYEYLNKMPRYKSNTQVSQEWKDKIWSKTEFDDIFKNRPKVGAW